MNERGEIPATSEDGGLSLKLEGLLQAYSSRLEALELRLPDMDVEQEPSPRVIPNYFPDEPAEPGETKNEAIVAGPTVAAAPELLSPPPENPIIQLPSLAASPEPAAAEDASTVRTGPVARPIEAASLSAGEPRALTLAIALAAAVSALGLWRLCGTFSRSSHKFFPLQARHLIALASDGTNLFSFNDGRLLRIDPEGRAEDAGPLSGAQIQGLARDESGAFWSSEPDQGVLYEHGLDAQRVIRKAYPYPHRRFAQIALLGDALWALDSNDGTAYQYMLSHSLLGTSLTPISQFSGSSETALASGLAVSDGLLWICDPAQRRILRYRAEGARLVPVDWLDLGPWIQSGSRVTGMTLTADALWVLTGWPAGLHRLTLGALDWKPSMAPR